MKFASKKKLLVFSLFVLITSLSQIMILRAHMQYGFSPDDVNYTSIFLDHGSNPFLHLGQLWNTYGSYHTPPLYYNGILFSLFGFNYTFYNVVALVFKILSIVSFYLLLQVLFRNNLLSFVAALISSFHYGSVGSLEMVIRTQDYLVITELNIFLILFYLKNVKGFKIKYWFILAPILFFLTFITNPARTYTILPLIIFFESTLFLKDINLPNFQKRIGELAILFIPFILLFILGGAKETFYSNIVFLMQKIFQGNLHLFLTPLTFFGSLFLNGDILKGLSTHVWNLSSFPVYFLGGPLIIFGISTLILSRILSDKPRSFFYSVMLTNLIFEIVIFWIIGYVLSLPQENLYHYDPYAFAPAAILGAYIISLTIFIFFEWKLRPNIYLSLYLLGISSSLIFIVSTWLLQDVSYIPLGAAGYSTLPSVGISAAITAVVILAYKKISKRKVLKLLAPSVFLILMPYFLFSNDQIQKYLQRYLITGMNFQDQIRMTNKFWSFVKNPLECNKFFYIDAKEDYPNGSFYSLIILDVFHSWYSLYSPYHSRKPCPVAVLNNDEKRLKESFALFNGEEGFFYPDSSGVNKFFPLKNFYAFKLQNRDIFDIKQEVLQKMK